MTVVAQEPDRRRVRASDRAIRIALKAIQDSGLSVDKVLISGGQIEIQCGGVAEIPPPKKHGRLKQW